MRMEGNTWIGKAFLVLVTLVCSSAMSSADTYTEWTDIDDVEITSHDDNDPVPAGDDEELTCSTSTDEDWCVPLEQAVPDTVTHTWSGAGTFTPETGTSVTWTAPDSSGDKTIWVAADDSPLYDEEAKEDSVVLKVHKVSTVVWETYLSNTPIDSCPKNGGKRIYPGKKTETDGSATDRKKVTVKATITPVIANVTVYLRAFDVDDPSASTSPIDDESGGKYEDNREGPGSPGTLSAASATTNASGEATVTLSVPMQPGDNARVTASTNQTKSNAVTLQQADDGIGLNALVVRTEMLTVWRKLHVELDSMASEEYTGNSTGLTNTVLTDANATWTVDQFNKYGEDWDVNADTNDNPGTWWDITDTTATTVTSAGSTMLTVAAAGNPYEVEFKGWGADDLLRGNLPQPNTGGASDAFDDAYITPVEDTGNNDTDTPWHFNFGNCWNHTVTYMTNHKGTTGAASFWVAYIIGTYDGNGNCSDNDPDTELAGGAAVELGEPEYACIYNENIRDIGKDYNWTAGETKNEEKAAVLHEVGHMFELTHSDDNNNVMWVAEWQEGHENPDHEEDTYGVLPLVYTPAQLDSIRTEDNP